MDVAAKTGTTNSNYDRWLCGFTPYYTAACWFGYEKNAVVYYGSSNPAGLIWSAIMKNIHTGLEAKTFQQPAGIVSATICKATGHTATSKCSSTYVEIFREGTVPTPCEGHSYLKICNETGLLASARCRNVHYASYPKVLDTEQNASWNTSYSGGGYGPTTYCHGNHTYIPEVVEQPTPTPAPATTPTPAPAQTQEPAPATTPETPTTTPTTPEATPSAPTPTTTPAPTPEPTPAPTPTPEAQATPTETTQATPAQ